MSTKTNELNKLSKTPTVSVIMPVYNAEQYLNRSINSVLCQSFTDFELILVNDGSKDSSLQICNDFAQKDCRVKVVNKENGGVSKARNTGISQSKGEYIAFIDSDDELCFDFLEKGINVAKNNNLDLVVFGIAMYTYNQNKEVEETVFGVRESKFLTVNDVLAGWNRTFPCICICGPVSKIYRASVIRTSISFDTNMSRAEDTCFNLDVLEKIGKLYFFKDIGYKYIRINENSLYGKFHKDIYEIHKKVFDKLRNLSSSLGISNYELEKDYFENLINGFHEHFWHYDKTTYGEKLTYAKKVSNDKNIRRLKYNGLNSRKKLILFLLKIKARRLLLFIFKKWHKK